MTDSTERFRHCALLHSGFCREKLELAGTLRRGVSCTAPPVYVQSHPVGDAVCALSPTSLKNAVRHRVGLTEIKSFDNKLQKSLRRAAIFYRPLGNRVGNYRSLQGCVTSEEGVRV